LKSTFSETLITKKKFSQLTLSAIGLAIENGIVKEYGEFFGINNSTLYFFVDQYLDSEKRKSALDKQNKFLNSNKPKEELSDYQKDQIYKAGALAKFGHYQKTKTFTDPGSVTFKYLMALGLLTYTKDQYAEFKEKATKELKAKNTNLTMAGMVSKVIREGIDSAAYIRSRACEICLADYFEILTNLGVTLESQIEKGYTNLK